MEATGVKYRAADRSEFRVTRRGVFDSDALTIVYEPLETTETFNRGNDESLVCCSKGPDFINEYFEVDHGKWLFLTRHVVSESASSLGLDNPEVVVFDDRASIFIEMAEDQNLVDAPDHILAIINPLRVAIEAYQTAYENLLDDMGATADR